MHVLQYNNLKVKTIITDFKVSISIFYQNLKSF